MSEHRIGVIVPIYNVETYLGECLDSLKAQTVRSDLEILLVDDGSTDGSADIARSFAAQESNVRYIRQANAGPGAARNRGVRESTAPFLAFVDADDKLPPDALERLRAVLLADGTQIAVGNMESFPVHRKWPWQPALERRRVVEDVTAEPILLRNASACNKLFRREIVEGRELFAEGRVFEDAYFAIPRLLRAKRISVAGAVTYHYRKRHDDSSTMDQLFTNTRNYWDHLTLAEFLAGEAQGVSPAAIRAVAEYNVASLQGFLARLPEHLTDEEMTEYLLRSRTLFADVPDRVIVANTHDLARRRAFHAITRHGTLEAYRSTMACDRLTVARGRFQLDLGELAQVHRADCANADMAGQANEDGTTSCCSESDEQLLRVTRHRVVLEKVALAPNSRDIHVVGRVVSPGFRFRTEQGHLRPAIRIGRRRFPARWQGRRVDGGELSRDFSYFTATIPAAKLATGTHRMRFVLYGDGSRLATQLQASSGLLRGLHTLWSKRGVQVRARPERGVRLVVDVSRSARAAALSGLRLDLRAFAQRKPFAGWRLVRLLTKPLVRRKVILYGERGDTAQDNGFVQFQYAFDSRDEARHFYVIDKEAARDLGLGGRREGLVWRGSLRHKFLVMHARVLVSSYDIDAYMLPPSWNMNEYRLHAAWRVGARRVFLQHGVTEKGVGASLALGTTGLSLMCSAGPREREYLQDATGYSTEVVETGFSRFDFLARTESPARRVLLMPTWRKYLVARSYVKGEQDPGTFEHSRFRQFYAELLASERLGEVLERFDSTLDVIPHYEIREHFKTIPVGSTRIFVGDDAGTAIREALLRSSVFVTDFSSVIFDAAYLGMPVIHAPFDQEEFYARHYPKGWFDFARDAIGPVALDVDQLIDAIEHYLANGCVRERVFDDRVRQVFSYRDTSNRERIHEQVRRLAGLPYSVPARPTRPERSYETPPYSPGSSSPAARSAKKAGARSGSSRTAEPTPPGR